MVVRVTSLVLRIAGTLALILGIIFWTGNLQNLRTVHMTLGLIVVLSLWVLAGMLAASKQPNWGIVATGFLLGLVVVFVGLQQERWLLGSTHWIVQVLHLLLGFSAIGVGEMIARSYKRVAARA